VTSSRDSYAAAGVDTAAAGSALAGLVSALGAIDPGRPRRSVLRSGHYAAVLALDERTGIALCTDGVGTKLIVAEQAGRFDTVGIDCIAMNVNDLVCVGAEPLAMVDYLAVERADPGVLSAVGEGLRRGAEEARIEIPGGELAQLPEMIRGHPSPNGIDLVGAAFGVVELSSVLDGDAVAPGDAVIGVASSGIHSNGFTLARRALLEDGGLSLDRHVDELGRTLADELLEPTAIYVRAALDLLRSEVDLHGLAHITGDGLLNLRRLSDAVGFEIDAPLEPQPIFDLIARSGGIEAAEMWEVFNMGTGLCCVVAEADADATIALLNDDHHPGSKRIGTVTSEAGTVTIPSKHLRAEPGEGFAQA
jgi:phosphoribosylformylglycinamidine cyclo-ligase